MQNIINKLSKYLALDNERGVTAIEYGLLAALVAVAIIVGAGLLGTALNGTFTTVAGDVTVP